MSDKTKEQILAKLQGMDEAGLRKLIDELNLKQIEAIKKYALEKDKEITMMYDKRKELHAQGNSLSKAELMLRTDEDVYLQKKILLALSTEKKILSTQLKVTESFFWTARI